MRYAISYVSTADPNLPQDDVKELLDKATKSNNREGINGILLCSESNFFQFIEGEEAKVKDLYSSIENDPRHSNIIKFIEKPVSKPAYEGFTSKIITDRTKNSSFTLNSCLQRIAVLDPIAQQAVKRVILSMIM